MVSGHAPPRLSLRCIRSSSEPSTRGAVVTAPTTWVNVGRHPAASLASTFDVPFFDRERPHCSSSNVAEGPSLCKNVRAPFSCVNFSHVEAISGDLLHRIRLLTILRGGRNEFLHSLGREQPDQQLAQCGHNLEQPTG